MAATTSYSFGRIGLYSSSVATNDSLVRGAESGAFIDLGRRAWAGSSLFRFEVPGTEDLALRREDADFDKDV